MPLSRLPHVCDVRACLLAVGLSLGAARGDLHEQSATAPEVEWPPAIAFAPPAFPPALLREPIYQGDVRLIISVAADGSVPDAVVVDAPHGEFALAVENSARTWRFAAVTSTDAFAQLPRQSTVNLRFERRGALLSLSHAEGGAQHFPARLHAGARTSARPDALDTPLRRESGSVPAVTGEVAVRFVVDATGGVRVPEVLKARSLADATTVLAALEDWRFAPPRQHGRPVQVEGVRRFRPVGGL